MKLLLDEHFSQKVAAALRARGFDVVSAHEIGLDGVDDDVVWERAISEGRVVVSYNSRDFTPLFGRFFHQGRTHPGLVVVSTATIRQHDLGAQVRALALLLEQVSDLTGQVKYLPRP